MLRLYHGCLMTQRSNDIRIEPVVDRRSLTDFIRAPNHLYRDDPYYVVPLEVERKMSLAATAPFFQHAQWQAWVAYDGRDPVARISAQIDQLHLAQHQDSSGYFGMFECPHDDALAARLFANAHEWLRERGMKRVAGPFNLGVNQELGLLVDGFDSRPFFMMPHGQPYYERLVEQQGYQRAQDLFAMVLDPAHPHPPLMRKLMQRYADEIHIRPVNRARLDEELACMCDIFNDAWVDNWGFVPFTQEEFQAMGHDLVRIVPEGLAQIAEVDGEPVAFCVMMPNINEAIADLNGRLLPFGWLKLLWRLKVRFPKTSRSPLMGVRKQLQSTPMGPALAFSIMAVVRQNTAALGVEQLEMSWILESNTAMLRMGEVMGAVPSQRYRMFERAL